MCVKPKFVDMNLAAVDAVCKRTVLAVVHFGEPGGMRLAASFRPHFSFEFKKSRKYGMLAGFLRYRAKCKRLPLRG